MARALVVCPKQATQSHALPIWGVGCISPLPTARCGVHRLLWIINGEPGAAWVVKTA